MVEEAAGWRGRGKGLDLSPIGGGDLGPAPTSPSTVHSLLLAPLPSRTGHRSLHPLSPSAEVGQSPQTQCHHLWHSLVGGRKEGVRQGLQTLFLTSHSPPETEVLEWQWDWRFLQEGTKKGHNRQLTRLSSRFGASTIPSPKEKKKMG